MCPVAGTDNVQAGISSSLIRSLTEIKRDVKSRTPLFGHLCKGNLQNPGVLRMSAIIGMKNDEDISEAFPDFEREGGALGHKEAFQLHVEAFGREKTLLNWLACWSRITSASRWGKEATITTASFVVSDAHNRPLHHSEKRGVSITVTFSTGLLQALMPKELAAEYLQILYDADSTDLGAPAFRGHTTSELSLFSATVNALRCVRECVDSSAALDYLCSHYLLDPDGRPSAADLRRATARVSDAERFQLLSALQIALAYVHRFAPGALEKGGGLVSVGRTAGYLSGGTLPSEVTMIPLMCMSTSASDHLEAKRLPKKLREVVIRSSINEVLSRVDSHGHGMLLDPFLKAVSDESGFGEGAVMRWRETLESSGIKPPFGDVAWECATWMAHLVSSLHKSKHEGSSLAFTFVIGDMSRIADSPLLELVPLRNEGFHYPPHRKNGTRVRNGDGPTSPLQSAKTALEKENYFWFQNGRYALVWDLAFSEESPSNLLALTNSSWHVFVEDARNGRLPGAADGAVIVGYLDGRGGGGLIVNGEQAFSLSQEGLWIERGEELESLVGSYLEAADGLDVDEREKLRKALVAVSNDPDSGCMLVLASVHSCNDFLEMGRPWKLAGSAITPNAEESKGVRLADLGDEELKALLCMDGAACVWLDGTDNRIRFRLLVRPNEGDGPADPCPSVTESLMGEGSRKWSASWACRGRHP